MSAPVDSRVQELRAELLAHPIYRSLDTVEAVRVFMSHHVFAVWDFMSLLKRLQGDLTCVSIPWMPRRDRAAARLINEIVLGEESDEDGRGGHASHFDLYLEAMRECGADSTGIHKFLEGLSRGVEPALALERSGAPGSVREFVAHTLDLATGGQTHEVGAAFFHGREDVIPEMFQAMIDEMSRGGYEAARLRHYLQRHVELDGDSHGPLAASLLAGLCAGDPVRTAQAAASAVRALERRIALWDGVVADLQGAGLLPASSRARTG